jgi:hypothetical protein
MITGVGRSAISLRRKGEAVHARHFDIEDDHVRPAPAHLVHREERVGGGGHDLDAGRAGERLRNVWRTSAESSMTSTWIERSFIGLIIPVGLG